MNTKLVHVWLPLGAVISVALLIHYQYPAEQFFLNLSTELVGILITVLYIDWLIERERRRSKLQVRQRIERSLREFLETFVIRLVIHLKCESTTFSPGAILWLSEVERHSKVVSFARLELPGLIRDRMLALPRDSLMAVGEQLRHAKEFAERALDLYAGELSDGEKALLLDLLNQSDCAALVTMALDSVEKNAAAGRSVLSDNVRQTVNLASELLEFLGRPDGQDKPKSREQTSRK